MSRSLDAHIWYGFQLGNEYGDIKVDGEYIYDLEEYMKDRVAKHFGVPNPDFPDNYPSHSDYGFNREREYKEAVAEFEQTEEWKDFERKRDVLREREREMECEVEYYGVGDETRNFFYHTNTLQKTYYGPKKIDLPLEVSKEEIETIKQEAGIYGFEFDELAWHFSAAYW